MKRILQEPETVRCFYFSLPLRERIRIRIKRWLERPDPHARYAVGWEPGDPEPTSQQLWQHNVDKPWSGPDWKRKHPEFMP